MKKVFLFWLIATVCLIFPLGQSFAAEEVVKIKFAHLGKPNPHKAAYTTGVVNFAHLLEKGSAGKFQVEMYPSGALGKELDLMEAVKNNVIQITSASMVSLSRIFPPAMVMMAPYVFKNDAIAWEVLDGSFGQKLLDAFTQKTGVKGLAIVDSGFLTITNNVRVIKTPEDFKGIKFRAMGPLQSAMFKSLGASAIPIAWPEVYTALQTGVADGQTNAAFVVNVFKLYEVQKYMSLANSQFGYQIWVCNKGWYDGLTDEDKTILGSAVKGGRLSTRSMALLREQESLVELKKAGMEITALSAEEIGSLQKLAGPACLTFLKSKMDPQWIDDLLKAVDQAEKKLGYK